MKSTLYENVLFLQLEIPMELHLTYLIPEGLKHQSVFKLALILHVLDLGSALIYKQKHMHTG